MKVATPPQAAVPSAPEPKLSADATKPKRSADATKRADACREFEAIFVRSMLAESGMAKRGDGAYGDLAVNAIAGSITQGEGLGLGEAIRRALETHDQASRNNGGGR